MKILITGATGFIGSHLVKALVSEGYHCRCLVRKTSNISELKKLNNIEFVYGDITEKDSLKGIAKGVDIVCHLAALMGHDPPSSKAFEKFRNINAEGTKNILSECVKTKTIKKVIHFSSTAAMGLVPQNPITESMGCRPYTPYQVSKFESEKIAKYFFEKYNLPIVIVRPSMIYGPGFKGDFLTIARVVKTGIFPKIGRGKNLSPALYIDDAVEAVRLLINKGRAGEIYLISSERSYELQEIVGIMETYLGMRLLLIPVPIWLAKMGGYSLEKMSKLIGIRPIVTYRNICSVVTDRVFDISKAKNELGFKQRVPLEAGLEKTLDWFVEKDYL